MQRHLVFIDTVYGYDALRPDQDAALGGTTSAICFLAREMMRQGIKCSLVNLLHEKSTAGGIEAYPLACLPELCRDPSVSAFVFCSRWQPDLVEGVKAQSRAPLIAWMHEACFEASNIPPLDAFDGVVFVSIWQAKANASFVKLHWQQSIIRNAMNPRFATLFNEDADILPQKEDPPLILYIGDFPRGGRHLRTILDTLYSHDPRFAFEAFTDALLTGDALADQAELDLLASRPYTRRIGKTGQAYLAKTMKKALIWLAPNPWPETSCINMIQAMASGLLCLSTNRAALAETSYVYGHMIPIEDKDHLFRYDMPIDSAAFAGTLAHMLRLVQDHPQAVEARLREQRAFYLSHYGWDDRVGAWIEFIKRFE